MSGILPKKSTAGLRIETRIVQGCGASDELPSCQDANEYVLDAHSTRVLLATLFDLPATTLAIEIARACNLRCPGCWVSIARDDLWTSAPADIMHDDLLDHALAFGRNAGMTKISLLGGEPTLHPNLPGVIDRARRAGYRGISVTTNGVVSPRRLVPTLAAGLTNVTFSIDGSSRHTHDAHRPSPNGRSTYEITMQSLSLAIAYASTLHYRVTVNYTVYPTNLVEVISAIRGFVDIGVQRVRLHFSMPGDVPGSFIRPSDWLSIRDEALRLGKVIGCEVLAAQVYGVNSVCAAQTRKSPYLTIQPDGDLVARDRPA